MIADLAAAVPAHVQSLPATNAELAVFFVVGLLGGAHCLGMCGPLVTLYSKRMNATGGGTPEAPDGGTAPGATGASGATEATSASGTTASRSSPGGILTVYEVRQHALFNVGRTISYATIGALFGLAGALLFDAATLVTAVGDGVRVVSGIAVGLLILGVGVKYALGDAGGASVLEVGLFGRIYGRLTDHVDRWVTGPGIVGLGLVHGLLPCPILYPAFLYAFARGSPTTGAVTLAVLGLGTFPTLFLYGTVVQSIDATHRERLHRALGVAFLVLGWMPLAHSLELLGIPIPHLDVPIYQPF